MLAIVRRSSLACIRCVQREFIKECLCDDERRFVEVEQAAPHGAILYRLGLQTLRVLALEICHVAVWSCYHSECGVALLSGHVVQWALVLVHRDVRRGA